MSYTPVSSATPPVPPPKPGSHEASGVNTPALPPTADGRQPPAAHAPPRQQVPDPGEGWLPQILQDKLKQDIAAILADQKLLNALTNAPQTIHPSLSSSHETLQQALNDNIALANHVSQLSTQLSHQRAATQAQLLSTHALERTWRAKEAEMDDALAPFAPARLYQQLSQGVNEQGQVCSAMEESFLESEDGELAEREVADWVRRYREARVGFYLRSERKERWDEGRVGGWR